MAIYSNSDYDSIIQIKKPNKNKKTKNKSTLCANSDTTNTINAYLFGIISSKNLRKLTQGPRGGGHIQISIQLKGESCQGPSEFTWPSVFLNRNLLVDRRLSTAASVCLSSLLYIILCDGSDNDLAFQLNDYDFL